jgi:archaemetzincin
VNSIHIVPIGQVNAEVLEAVEMSVWQMLGLDVRRMPPLDDPGYAFDESRGQYGSALILRDLLKRAPREAVRVLGVTELDLFIPMLSFVFGHAQVNGRAAVVSFARLRQEFYHLPSNNTLTLSRAIKEAMHELGHTFGLTHCVDTRCVMSLSNTVQQVDGKADELCMSCSIVLHENMQRM